MYAFEANPGYSAEHGMQPVRRMSTEAGTEKGSPTPERVKFFNQHSQKKCKASFCWVEHRRSGLQYSLCIHTKHEALQLEAVVVKGVC